MGIISSRPTIKTKFIGPTNYRGSRIKASAEKGSEHTYSNIISYPGANSVAECHLVAVKALLAKLREKHGIDWGTEFAVGYWECGYYFIPIDPGYNVVNIEG